MENNEVRHVWRVTIRSFGIYGTRECGQKHCWLVATDTNGRETQVAQECYKRFGQPWWSNHTICDMEYVGKLCMLDGQPLYEKD